MTDPIKRRYDLPEVVVTAKRTDPKRYRSAKEKVTLHLGEEIDKSRIDSLSKTPHGKLIGRPIEKPGQKPRFGPDDSDLIRQMMMKK